MDFNLKQWRDESEEEEQETSSSAKLPRLNQHTSSPALPLFLPQPTTNHLHDYSTTTTKLPGSGSFFSMAQWQELELQALIFRHIIAGAAVPPELLHLVKKSIISSPPPYYFCNPLHYHPSLLQSGYWGKAAMDPEPGRCRRTDGKKWRCSRDVVVGQKYCERHMHRGRNRSRKPVEIPTSAGGGGGEPLKPTISLASAVPRFSLSGPFSSMDLLHHNQNQRPKDSETKHPFEVPNGGDRTLRHFFDDWPRSDMDDAANSATNLSISTSDFSLKLGTCNGDESGPSGERYRPWGMTWETGRAAPMGGPLAEALWSSVSASSPTSVLHRLQRSETSYATS